MRIFGSRMSRFSCAVGLFCLLMDFCQVLEEAASGFVDLKALRTFAGFFLEGLDGFAEREDDGKCAPVSLSGFCGNRRCSIVG